ncbi:hypothetical protein D3C85_914390 [compost metagenome]
MDPLDNVSHRFTGLEVLLAFIEEHAGVHVLTAAQTPGIGAEFDFLVGVDAKVSQHEFRPVLVKIAEKHQAQAIAQAHDGQTEQAIRQRGTPVSEATCLGKQLAHSWQPIGLLAFGLVDGAPQALDDFSLEQYLEQCLDRQRQLFIDPTEGHERFGCVGDVTDFGVVQLAGPEMNPLAHDHPDQQRPGLARQSIEVDNEPLLFNAEYIGIAKPKPIKHLHEVVQVIERIVERVWSHRKMGHGEQVLVMRTDTSKPRPAQSEKDGRKRCQEIFSARRTFCRSVAPTALEALSCSTVVAIF